MLPRDDWYRFSMVEGKSGPHPAAYFDERAEEILKLAGRSHFDDVRGNLLQLALQYRRLAARAELLAAGGIISTPQEPDANVGLRGTAPRA
jgi:hypothetical protein